MVASGFETNGFQKLAKNALDDLCRERNIFPNIKPLDNYLNKVARILKWQSMVERQEIEFDKEYSDMELLLMQLNALGTREHDDGADAWAMAMEVSMLQGEMTGDFESTGSRMMAREDISMDLGFGGGNKRLISGFRI